MQKVAIILETDKNNKEALYYGTINELSVQNYPKSLKFSTRLLEIDPSFNKVTFLANVICLNNLRKYNEAIYRV